jgi:hypothetical protein
LYCFHGWSLHEPVLIFGYDVYHRLPESTGQNPELSESTELGVVVKESLNLELLLKSYEHLNFQGIF